jgi:hypothetical protein
VNGIAEVNVYDSNFKCVLMEKKMFTWNGGKCQFSLEQAIEAVDTCKLSRVEMSLIFRKLKRFFWQGGKATLHVIDPNLLHAIPVCNREETEFVDALFDTMLTSYWNKQVSHPSVQKHKVQLMFLTIIPIDYF